MHACSCTMLRITWHYFFNVFGTTFFFKIVRFFKKQKMMLKIRYFNKYNVETTFLFFCYLIIIIKQNISRAFLCKLEIFFHYVKSIFDLFSFLTFLYILEIYLSFNNITTSHVLQIVK